MNKPLLKKVVLFLSLAVVAIVLSMVSYVGWKLYPHDNQQPLPDNLIALDSEQGQALLSDADYKTDHEYLDLNFASQATISYCGVASGVTVLSALGTEVNQFNFFNSETDAVRSRRAVTFGGMSLHELAGLLEVHGKSVQYWHAEMSSEEDFRQVLTRNLGSDGDYVLVNYQREALGQGRVGHISPISAYHSESDMVLIMDTAAHKYPPTWVPVSLLFTAMTEVDRSSGKSRGYLEITNS